MTFPTTELHQNIGSELHVGTTIVAELVIVSSTKVCELEQIDNYSGKVVMVDLVDDYFKSLSHQQDMMRCVERGNAQAVIMNYHNILVPGFSRNFNQHVTNKLTIPALNSADPDVKRLIESHDKKNTIVISLTQDKNTWQELWSSNMFFICWRVVLSLLNALGIVVSCCCLYIHYKDNATTITTNTSNKNRHSRQSSPFAICTVRRKENQRIMTAGCLVELTGFTIRTVYCCIGPLYSTSTLSFAAQVFLQNITVPLEVAGALISTVLFMRWGSFGKLRLSSLIERALLVFAFCLATPLQIGVAMMGYFQLTALRTMAIINIAVVFMITGTTSLLFLSYGSYFVIKLDKRVGGATKLSARRAHALSKAMVWIILSGLMQLVVLAGTGAAFNESFFNKPKGFNLCYMLVYFGISMQGLTHVLAFVRPIGADHNILTMPISPLISSARSSVVLLVAHSSKLLNVLQAQQHSASGMSDPRPPSTPPSTPPPPPHSSRFVRTARSTSTKPSAAADTPPPPPHRSRIIPDRVSPTDLLAMDTRTSRDELLQTSSSSEFGSRDTSSRDSM